MIQVFETREVVMTLRCRTRILLLGTCALLIGAVLVSNAETTDTWRRIARGGFAAAYNPFQYSPNTFCVFKGQLYAATGGGWELGQIWRYDGTQWTMVYKSANKTPFVMEITALGVLGDYLYAGMVTNQGDCQVWRTRGTGAAPYAWAKISGPNNVGGNNNFQVSAMVVSGGQLYLGTRGRDGGRIWRYNGTAWTQVVGQGPSSSPTGPGFGTKENSAVTSLAVSPSGEIIAGTYRSKGCEVWRETSSGWVPMNVPGFGSKKGNITVGALAYLGSVLYAMTENYQNGCQVLKYLGPGPEDWKAVHVGGFGDPHSDLVSAAVVFGAPARLYLNVRNYETGVRIIRTDGKTWKAVSTPGFGQGDALPTGGGLVALGGLLYAGAGGEAGASIYATPGGAKIPHTWTLKNEPGFSKNNNYRAGPAVFFRGVLYVGTSSNRGSEVWRLASGAWKRVAVGGFGDAANIAVTSMAADNAFLYAGTYNRRGCAVWRYDGTTWTKVNKPGFGDSRTPEATSMAFLGGQLFVGTSSYDTLGKVWRYDGPGPANWTRMNAGGFGVSHTIGVASLAVFDDRLYAGTYDSNDPCRVWRYDGPAPTDWTAVSEEGFGEDTNRGAYALAVYKGSLYAGTFNARMTGCEVWKFAGSGTTWTKAGKNGFGDYKNTSPTSMLVHNGLLYVGTSNSRTGGEIWAYDGHDWTQVNKNGFDITFNGRISALASDGTSLFAGTENDEKGGEIWTNGAAGVNLGAGRDDDKKD
jgi:hypothetical protein